MAALAVRNIPTERQPLQLGSGIVPDPDWYRYWLELGAGVRGAQPADATLDGIAAMDNTLGVVCETAIDVFTKRTIVAGTGITVTFGDGVGGNPSIAVTAGAYQPLDATLTALAAFNTNGILTQTAPDTFAGRTLAAGSAALAWTNPAGTAGDPSIDVSATLGNFNTLGAGATVGLVAHTAAATFANRTIVSTSAALVVTNGDGAAGNPSLALAEPNVQTFDASGTWTKPAGATLVLARAWGAGGAGGRAGAANGGGGGGGGDYNELWFLASALGATVAATVGAGGAAVTVDDTDGGVGGNTTFSTLTAFGGGGGCGNTATGGGGGGGGGMGTAGTSATTTAGVAGGLQQNFGNYPGGTGGAAGAAGTAGGNALCIGSGGGGGGAGTAGNGAVGGGSTWGGAGGGGGGTVAGGGGGFSVWGGGGGAGGGGGGAGGGGGTSAKGGNGGGGATGANAAGAGTQPGGGGGGSVTGNSGKGGDGRIIVYTW